jgi:flagellar hook-basal body complex protein FliE
MAGEISGVLPPVLSTPGATDAGRTQGAAGSAFASIMDAVQSTEGTANQAVAGMLDGSVDIHDAMIALQRADMTMQLSVQIRNKLVSAYQEIMRMPV